MSDEAKHILTIACACGAVHRGMLGHYDRLRAKCGRIYWALQPRRDGPLELFPWPGLNLTRQEILEKEKLK